MMVGDAVRNERIKPHPFYFESNQTESEGNMKALVIILAIIFIIVTLSKKRKPKVAAPDDDSWKSDRNRTTRSYNSAGQEINPRRNVMVFDKRTGKIGKASRPFND